MTEKKSSIDPAKLASSKRNRALTIIRALNRSGKKVPKEIFEFQERFSSYLRKDSPMTGVEELADEFDKLDKKLSVPSHGMRGDFKGSRSATFLWNMSDDAVLAVGNGAKDLGINETLFVVQKAIGLAKSKKKPSYKFQVEMTPPAKKKTIRLTEEENELIRNAASSMNVSLRCFFEFAVLKF